MMFSEYISRIREIYEAYDQALHLKPGASRDLIRESESEFGFEIATALSSAWDFANGGEEWNVVFAREHFLTGYDFLSIEEALSERSKMKERAIQYADYVQPEQRDPRIREGWYQSGWLPFASFSGASLMLIADYSPALGRKGQIISFTHDPDRIEYVCDDFSELLVASLRQISDDPEEYFYE